MDKEALQHRSYIRNVHRHPILHSTMPMAPLVVACLKMECRSGKHALCLHHFHSIPQSYNIKISLCIFIHTYILYVCIHMYSQACSCTSTHYYVHVHTCMHIVYTYTHTTIGHMICTKHRTLPSTLSLFVFLQCTCLCSGWETSIVHIHSKSVESLCAYVYVYL